MAQTEKRAPVKTFRVGLCSASVFRNGGDDGNRSFLSVALRRRRRDGDGWKSSTSFGLADLANGIRVMELVAQAYVEAEEAEHTAN